MSFGQRSWLGVRLFALVLAAGLPSSRLMAEELLPSKPLSADEAFDFSNSRAQGVLFGTITRIETVLDSSTGVPQVRKIVHVTPESWIRPSGVGSGRLGIEATSNRLETVLPVIDGKLSRPVRALLFLRAIPEANTRLMRGLGWVLPAESIGIPNGVLILPDSSERVGAITMLDRSSARLSPEGMTIAADLVLSGVRQLGVQACTPPLERIPCVTYAVKTVYKGSSDASFVTVYSDPPRGLPSGEAVLFLARMQSGEYRVLHSGYGSFVIEAGRIPFLHMDLSELRQIIQTAPLR